MDLEKLMMSKAIMDRHNTIGRGQVPDLTTNTMVENFNMPNARYNINPEMLSETPQMPVSIPSPSNTAGFTKPSVDAIKKSKLPDEIKKLMMEHPIAQPNQSPTMTMSNELIEKSRRLMGHNEGSYIPESAKPKSAPIQQSEPTQNTGINYKLIQKMINEAVTKSLKENGLIAESTEKSNETFSFKVGKHVFEGRVTKIKKMS